MYSIVCSFQLLASTCDQVIENDASFTVTDLFINW